MPKGRKKGRFTLPEKGRRKNEIVKENQTDITVEGLGRRKKEITKGTLTDSPVEGIEFIYDLPATPRRFRIKKNSQTKDPINVSRELFEEDKLRKSTKDVRLTFEDSKVLITYIGSSGGIWVESKKGALTKDSPHELKDGDKIVFGVNGDPGFENGSEAVRVKVKFLPHVDEPYRSPRASLDIPNRLAVLQEHKPLEAQSTRVAPQARLLSTAPVERHRKTLSLCDAKPETPYTELEPQVRIPWSEACHLGYGVNALTGEHTGTTVFSDNLKPVNKWNTRTSTKFRHLKWQTVKDLQDDFEVGVGATVNVLSPPVGANANITNLLFETTSTSTVLVQYRHEALLTSDSVPHNPSVQKELEKLNSMEFRARYGDYYIAGYDKACSCSMIVECKTDKETVTENHTQEVVALVGKYLNGDIKIGDIETERSSWSLLSVRVDTEGYPDHLNFFNKILDVQNAPQILSEIVENTHEGFPRTAILKHYSTLLTLHHLSRRIDHIPSLTFERARVMRHTYAYLRDCCLLHPALDGFRHDLRAIREVLERFRKLERYLVLAANGSEKAKDVDALMQDLHSRKKRADMLIERYDFIRKIMEMDTRILRAPTNYDKTMPYYRWHCGKTDEVMDNESPSRKQTIDESSELAKSNPFLDKSFGQCHEVFQFRWTTPETTGGSIISSPPKNITFSTRRDTLPPLPPLKKRSLQTYRDAVGWLRRTRRIPEQPSINGKTEALLNTPGQPNGIATDLTFHPCLSNHKPVYILGWTLSCYWPVQGTVPDIRVKHRSILSDRLTISVPNTRPAQWHCTVFYVRQSEYNFSDLLKPRDKSSPSNRTPNWFQRVFGN